MVAQTGSVMHTPTHSTHFVARELILDASGTAALGPAGSDHWEDLHKYITMGPGCRWMLHRLAGRFGVHDPPVPGSVQDFPEDVCLAELIALHEAAQQGLWEEEWLKHGGLVKDLPALGLDDAETLCCISHKYIRLRRILEAWSQGRSPPERGNTFRLHVRHRNERLSKYILALAHAP